jgi:hypothetical protein
MVRFMKYRSSSTHTGIVVAFLAVLTACATQPHAGSARIVLVVDELGHPIPGATVSWTDGTATTDSHGLAIVSEGLERSGTISASADGFVNGPSVPDHENHGAFIRTTLHSVDAALCMASGALESGDPLRAERLAAAVVAARPGEELARVVQIVALLQLGERDAARSAIQRAQAACTGSDAIERLYQAEGETE